MKVSGNISGNAASITGSITERQVTGLSTDLNSANTAVSNEATLRAAGDAATLSAAEAFSSNASNLSSGTVPIGLLPSLSSLYVDLTGTQTIGGDKTFTGNVTFGQVIINQSTAGEDAMTGKRFPIVVRPAI